MSPYEGGDNSWNTNFRNAANDAGGMDLFFIGGHDNYDHAVIPGDNFSPDDTPTRYTRFGIDHPVAMIVGCHGGVPVPDIDVDGGADHSMVYDLIREGARAYIGATGFSYGSPNDLHRCTWGERLMQRFFDNLMRPGGSNSMALGAALARAKSDYVFGFGNRDYLDRKTVTEFNLYGVPWSFLFYPDAGTAYAGDIAGSAGRTKEVGFSILTKPVVKAPEAATYTRTLEIRIDSYKVAKETQDNVQYHIISIPGGEVAVGPELPILPYIKGFELPLPTEAQVTAVNVVEASSQPIGKLNIPTADVLPWSQGGMKYTTETRVNYLYPPAKDLVQYQKTGDAVLFTVFPIQHNPSSGDTIFYKEFRVNVTYVAPLTIAITEFSTDKPIYLPGETIRTTTFIENIGDMDARLWAELLIKDAIGEIVGSSKSDDFTVPAGKARKIELAWEGVLADAGYTAQINLFSDKTPTGGASRSISVRGGGISEVLVPERLYAGETGIFEVWFANYRTKAVSGEVRLSIQDTAEGFVQELPPKSIQVGAQTEGAVSFLWTPVGLNGGPFSAKVDVEVNDMEYGPTSRSFVVIPTACQGDLDIDGDSDGRDLNLFMTAKPEIHLQDLADYFGRNDCRP
jgi:hypothetical protein